VEGVEGEVSGALKAGVRRWGGEEEIGELETPL
jgi:hypothetical protein